jgi:hypothetical protein
VRKDNAPEIKNALTSEFFNAFSLQKKKKKKKKTRTLISYSSEKPYIIEYVFWNADLHFSCVCLNYFNEPLEQAMEEDTCLISDIQSCLQHLKLLLVTFFSNRATRKS